MKTAAERVHWVDVAKGILILLVIFHHIPQVALSKGWDTSTWNAINDIRYFYCCFFMAAFFLLTGYCSGFKKSFFPFLWRSFKSLIIPAISISILLFLLRAIGSEETTKSIIKGVATRVIWGGGNWFLSSLFLSRIFFWIINKFIGREFNKVIVCVSFVVIGFVCHDLRVPNIWFFQHAFAMTIFLYIGDLMKKLRKDAIKKIIIIGTIVFLSLWTILLVLSFRIPSLNAGFKVTTGDIPLYIILSLSGSCLVLLVSMWIERSRMLEYFGKNSLTIYLFQIFYINLVLNGLHSYFSFNETIMSQIFTFACTFILVTLLCSATSFVLNTRYLRFIIGK